MSNALPRHVAIVMDGNGRWAQRRHLPRIAGHKKGVDALKRVVKLSAARGIGVLTVFAFSSENWSRPEEEVSGLMELLALALAREVKPLAEEGVRLRFIGDRSSLSQRLKDGLSQAEQATASNERLLLNVCFNYGGRWDVVQAARQLAVSGQEITESALSSMLATAHCGDPDLLIRTGGEMRLSNFLLWQSAYAELFFSATLWPDFDGADLDAAIDAFGARERRFGLTSAQVEAGAAG